MEENFLSKSEQESHTRLFQETVNKDKFEGLYITGQFEEPALVLCMDRMPNKEGINIFKNSVKLGPDGDFHLYFYITSSSKGFKVSKMNGNIEQIYLTEELLNRYNLKILLIDGDKREFVTFEHFIDTIEL